MRSQIVLVALVFAVSGCRDEQAGPKPKVGRAAPTGSGSSSIKTLDGVPSDLSFRSGVTWGGGAITYLGSKVEPKDPKPGDQVTLHHYFVATKQTPAGVHFFMHLVDAQLGPAPKGRVDWYTRCQCAPPSTVLRMTACDCSTSAFEPPTTKPTEGEKNFTSVIMASSWLRSSVCQVCPPSSERTSQAGPPTRPAGRGRRRSWAPEFRELRHDLLPFRCPVSS